MSVACPRCDYYLDEVIGVTITQDAIRPGAPRPHDLTVCPACAAILVARPEGPPHWLTVNDIARLPQKAREAVMNAAIIALCVRPSTIRHVFTGEASHARRT